VGGAGDDRRAPRRDPAVVAGAKIASAIAPMLATPSPTLPAGDDWSVEVKWDGVRAIARVDDGALCLTSRNLLDITGRYPELAGLTDALSGRGTVVLDGEVVAFGDDGRPSFQRLQERMHVASAAGVQARMAGVPVLYAVFDLLMLDGEPLFDRPWTERRAALESLALAGPAWQVPAAHVGAGAAQAVFEATREQGLEGVVAKRVTSKYEPGRRSRHWLKVKHTKSQELVIGGWALGEGRRAGRIGALLLGYHDDAGQLHYAGNVGTGFTERMLDELARTFAPLERDDPPFVDPPRLPGVTWLDPKLVAEIAFTEWTREGTLRHPSFKGLRDDKQAGDVVRES
jgi:bifunctional non-homologous end joining protein LigD